jgi:hypothetical protein
MLLILALFVAFAGQQELLMLRRREAQRQLEQASAAEPAVVDPYAAYDRPAPIAPAWSGPAWDVPPPILRDPTFSGVVWDRTWQVWVRWQNGMPVEAYWGRVD